MEVSPLRALTHFIGSFHCSVTSVEMEVSPLRALTPNASYECSIIFFRRNGSKPVEGIDTMHPDLLLLQI